MGLRAPARKINNTIQQAVERGAKAVTNICTYDLDVQNSESIHMWAAMVVTTPKASWTNAAWAWAATLLSLSLVLFQLTILTWTAYESSHPACFAHDECQAGQYCAHLYGVHATDRVPHLRRMRRCDDCLSNTHVLHGYGLNDSQCQSIFGVPGDASYPRQRRGTAGRAIHNGHQAVGYVNVDLSSSDIDFHDNSTNAFLVCAARSHCRATGVYWNRCDYITRNLRTVHPTTYVILSFVALLLMVPLAADIDQAVMEEAVLEYAMVRQRRDRTHTAQNTAMAAQITMLAGHGIALSLSLRRTMLPFMITVAGVGVLINSPLSSVNILLNSLAIAFIAETDNMVATLLLPDEAKRRPDAIVEQLNAEAYKEHRGGFLWVRLTALYCVFLMVMAFHPDNGLEWLHLQLQDYFATAADRASGKINIVECGNIYDTLMTVMSAAPWFAMLLRVLGVTTFTVREVLSYRAEGQSLRQEYPGVSVAKVSFIAALQILQGFALDVSGYFMGLTCIAFSIYVVSEVDRPHTVGGYFEWREFPGVPGGGLAVVLCVTVFLVYGALTWAQLVIYQQLAKVHLHLPALHSLGEPSTVSYNAEASSTATHFARGLADASNALRRRLFQLGEALSHSEATNGPDSSTRMPSVAALTLEGKEEEEEEEEEEPSSVAELTLQLLQMEERHQADIAQMRKALAMASAKQRTMNPVELSGKTNPAREASQLDATATMANAAGSSAEALIPE